MNKKTKLLALNGIVAALYIAITMLIQPVAFLGLQFRLPEMFNHLVVFNKKYFFGIVLGVFIANLLFSPMLWLDLIFGVGHTIICLAITIWVGRYVKNVWARMMINSLVFSFMMFIIALELEIAEVVIQLENPISFLQNWLIMGIGEFAVMSITAPIIYAIDKVVHFEKTI